MQSQLDIQLSQEDIQGRREEIRSFRRKAENLLDKLDRTDITLDVQEERSRLKDYEYFDFEKIHRGSREEIKTRQEKYIAYFEGLNNVLDIGCGRGEFLELCKEQGIQASGIDVNEDMVHICRELGFSIEQADLFEYLEKLEDGKLGGIFLAQVIEHLTPEEINRFINLSSEKIESKGIILIETINPLTLAAIPTFWIDLSHIRPVHPESLRQLLENAGFVDVKVVFSSPFPEEYKLEEVRFIDHHSATETVNPATEIMNRNFEKINSLLFGNQDYAIIGRRI